MRVPVISSYGEALMPTQPSRARRWIKQGKAIGKWSKLGVFYVQMTVDCGNEKQAISAGLDPGKHYAGVALQSAKCTLIMLHICLPFKTVRERMEQRRMMRRSRRGRRINRKLPFSKRAHRQERFSNRRQSKLPPSIRANKQLELQILQELAKLYPISHVVVEEVKAKGDKGFSPVMVGQAWQLEQLRSDGRFTVKTMQGWQTSQLRSQLGLVKQKHSKSDAIPATHAVDGIALAASRFFKYRILSVTSMGWKGKVDITSAQFVVVRRPPISRRQLHLMVPSKGGIRRKYGGTVTRHGLRKGDLVNSPKGIGYVSGDTEKQVSVSNAGWRRLGQIAVSRVQLIRRSTGLVVTCQFNVKPCF